MSLMLAALAGCVAEPADPPAPSPAPDAATASPGTAAPSPEPSAPEPSMTRPAVADPSPRAVRRARRHLDRLASVERSPDGLPDYRREAFGSAWADVDGNGCNQRDDVLLRDAVPDTVRTAAQGACDHDVLAGAWVDPYSGVLLEFDDLKDLRQAQAIQIDHVVPLAEAWISGAAGWSDEQRRGYANDLGVLLAVDGPANAGKGADDPAAWRPREPFQCAYAVAWIGIKHSWALAADASEVAALDELLATCS